MPLQPRRSRVWPIVSLAVIALAALAGVFVALNSLSNRPSTATLTATPNTAATSPALAAPSTPATTVTADALPTLTAEPPTATAEAMAATAAPATVAETATPEAPTPEPSPTPEPPPPTAEAKVITYTVVAGDSCYAIFQRFDIPVADIIRINKLSSNCFILPGDVLIVSK
jgi:LysM repeat protein